MLLIIKKAAVWRAELGFKSWLKLPVLGMLPSTSEPRFSQVYPEVFFIVTLYKQHWNRC